MADLYNTVKKQGEQLDGLQKKVTNNSERISTLETRSQATPPAQPTATPQITVNVPDNIATKESLAGLLESGLKAQTKVTAQTIAESMTPVVEKMSNPVVDEATLEKVAQKCADKAFANRYSKLEDSAERLNYRVRNLTNGTIWASIPRWCYILFSTVVIIATGLSFYCNYLYKQNSYLQNVEWLYRYERGLYKNHNIVIPRERILLHGTTHERDSIKALIRNTEHNHRADTTFINYYPTDM